MSTEFVPVFIAVLGSGVVSSVFTAWFGRRKTGAESEHIRMQTADLLITKLSLQLNDAFERIRHLEDSERRLQAELDELKAYVHARGLPWPLMP